MVDLGNPGCHKPFGDGQRHENGDDWGMVYVFVFCSTQRVRKLHAYTHYYTHMKTLIFGEMYVTKS